MKTLNNSQKFNSLLEELQAWADGSDSDGSLEYALQNGFHLHAVSLWQGSGASQLPFTVSINRKAEMKEINALCDSADIFVCKDCNHHGFYSKGELEKLDSCYSCGSSKVEKEEV